MGPPRIASTISFVALVLTACHGAPHRPGATPRERPHAAWEAALPALRDAPDGGSQAYALVQSLTDESGPRLAGSPGNARGVAWALRTLPTLGLAHVVAEPVTVQRWERRAESARITAPSEHVLAVCALGHSVPTPTEGLEAEVVRVASLEALEALAAGALDGKIAFVDRETPRRSDGSGYGDAVGGRVEGASAAAAKGAVAIVIRSIGTAHDRFPHTGIVRYDDDVPRIPAAAISTADADLLARLVASEPTRLRLALDVAELGPTETANVVGEVPGTGATGATGAGGELVLLGAHLDSWDLGTGAIDDGAGVGIVLEAARRIAHASRRPARTVRVVLFANEESGGDGAKAYATAHAAELGRHVLALEADSGDGRVLALRTATTRATLPAYDAIARALAPLGVPWTAGAPHGGADLGAMHRAGVPVVDAHQDATRYFDNHHTANDTMAIVARDELDQAASAVTALAWAAANVDGAVPFGRSPIVDANAAASRRPRHR